MDRSEMAARLYGKIAESYSRTFTKPSEHIDDFLKGVRPKGNILDAGCGPGLDAHYMSKKGFIVTGVDLSQEMIRIAKTNYPGIDFRKADMRTLRFPRESFDGILMSYSLCYIPKSDCPMVLRDMNRFLKAKGMIYIILQSGESEERFIREPMKPDEDMFLNVISRDESRGLLNDAGFSIIKEMSWNPEVKEEFAFMKLGIIARKRITT